MKLLVGLLLLGIYLIIRRKQAGIGYWLFSFLFVSYLIIALNDVVGFPDLAEFQRMLRLKEGLFHPSITLIPFSEGIFFSTFLNVLFFIPMGGALSLLWLRFRSIWSTILYGAVFSLMIEIGQLFTLHRESDINDLLANTLGVLCGWLIAYYLPKMYAKDGSQNRDWLIYPVLALLVVFFI